MIGVRVKAPLILSCSNHTQAVMALPKVATQRPHLLGERRDLITPKRCTQLLCVERTNHVRIALGIVGHRSTTFISGMR